MSSTIESGFYLNRSVRFESGFDLAPLQLLRAACDANQSLAKLPPELWKRIDLKASGAIVGAYLATEIARRTGAMVNPIEKGHPDVIPVSGANASEEELRNFPEGLEIKGTCGGIPKGVTLRAGQSRCDQLDGITWQAHHREVDKLLGIIWDFREGNVHSSPFVTAAFYSADLIPDDWGKISGTTGRNTKVSGMLVSGKRKMASGAICILAAEGYLGRYKSILTGIPIPPTDT